jgi:transaldolase/glucose-6-phosphate isomerase
MTNMAEKREQLRGDAVPSGTTPGWQHLSASLGPYQAGVDEAVAKMSERQIPARIWAHDHTVWKPEPTEISNRLGWLHSAETMRDNVSHLQTLMKAVQADGYTHALLLGMGGSSLAPELFHETFAAGKGTAEAHRPLALAVLDSTDPAVVLDHAERLDLTRTLFIVSSKSGTTVESLSFFKFFYNRVADAVGAGKAGKHFIAITDPGTHLVELADHYHFRAAFTADPNIGGRYSALSRFGLVPAALVGVDVPLLLDRALAMSNACGALVAAEDNPGVRLGAILGELAKAGRDKVTFVTSSPISSFGDWVEQLIAESTGKEGRGILPVVREPLGLPRAYGDDRLFVYLRLDGHPEKGEDELVQAYEDAGFPVVRLHLHDAYDLGGQFFLWEMATAVASHLLGINPFDQPDVEAAKVRAREMTNAYIESGTLPHETPLLTDEGITVYGDFPAGSEHNEAASPAGQALIAFLNQGQPGAYVALQAYLQPTVEVNSALRSLSARVRDRFHLATTVGYGPRYLHSTGQLHKGDAGRGLFIQFTVDDLRDAPIPDEAGSPGSSITFGLLKAAQALGDRQALRDAGRRVIRFHLGTKVNDGLNRLEKASL